MWKTENHYSSVCVYTIYIRTKKVSLLTSKYTQLNSDSKETKCPSKSYNGASLVACAYVRRAKQFKKDKPEPINVNAIVCVRCHFDEELVAARRRDGVSFLLHTSVKLSKSYLAVAATMIHNVTYVRTYTQYTCLNVRGRWSSSIATLYFFSGVCIYNTHVHQFNHILERYGTRLRSAQNNQWFD